MPDMQTCIKAVEDSDGDAAVLYRSELLAIFDLDTVEQREEAFRLMAIQFLTKERQQGESKEVNRILGLIFPSQISRRQKHEQDVSSGEAGGRPQTFSPEVIWRMRDSGMTQRQIALELGCNPKTVQRAIKAGRPEAIVPADISTTDVPGHKDHQWADERPANDHPYVGESGQTSMWEDDDLPF